jgi:class 3 adenylate cyclase
MHCTSCGFDNPEGMNFCGKCATPLAPRCPQCGFENPPGFAFCGKCATPLAGQAGKKGEKVKRGKGKKEKKVTSGQWSVASSQPPIPNPQSWAGERRQLTVMFCDLVGSTALSARLDPEEYRAVVQAYQATSTTVIERYAGHIAQHLGDGLLVYFGYPTAHEDDARRAVRTGLEIITALQKQVPSPLVGEVPFFPSPFQGEGSTSSASAGEGSGNDQFYNTPHPSPLPQGARELQVRIGIHTGLVVVGEVGGGTKREQLALGETPNIAARVQAQAAPNEVWVSAATLRLVHGLFETEDRGPQELN